MSATRIEFSHLARFVAACQNPSISDAARELGIATSALSTSLRTLEDELRLKLFLRRGGFLSPLPAAFWLFERALESLHAEESSRRIFRRKDFSPTRLQVRLDLSLTIGRVSKALNRAVAGMARLEPGLVVEPRFLRHQEKPSGTEGRAEAGQATSIDIGYCPGLAGEGSESFEPFHDDVWLSVGLADDVGRNGGPHAPLLLLDMRSTLIEDVTRYATREGMAARLKPVNAPPADLARWLIDHPHVRFLMPSSMISDRLGLVRARLERLDPPLVSRIGARILGPEVEIARRFVDYLRDGLECEEANTVFEPRLTSRQIHYFNLVRRCGGISAAARVANVTQPSISTQIHRMEATLDETLFERRRDGAVTTENGRRLFRLTRSLEAGLDHTLKTSRDIAAHTQSRIAIGTLPSSGHDSAMTGRIAAALTTVRATYPEWLLHIVEGTNSALHDQVRAGELNLAVVTVVQAPMARIPLGPSERLSVVAHPTLNLGGQSAIPLEEACALPLVLGPRHLGIHQAFVTAAAARHIRVRTVMEVGSLSLAIAMVRRAPLCTVLPMSSVQRDVSEGRLTAMPIAEDVIAGKISVIFSPERALSSAERAVIQALVAMFGNADAEAAS